jgi:hypothetical protein
MHCLTYSIGLGGRDYGRFGCIILVTEPNADHERLGGYRLLLQRCAQMILFCAVEIMSRPVLTNFMFLVFSACDVRIKQSGAI